MPSGPERSTALGRFSRLACFTLLTGALAYTVLNQGGRTSVAWNTSLAILGAGAVFYLLSASPAERPPFLRRWVGWVFLLPAVYVGFQLMPLPLTLLNVLSPARAKLADSLAPISQAVAFAPISIDRAITAIYLLRTVAYGLAALLICEISWHEWRRRSWASIVAVIGIAAFEACLGIFQSTYGGEVSGTYRSRDHFAGLLEMVLPLAVVYGISLLKDPDEPGDLPVSKAIQACAAFVFAAAMLVGLVYSLSKMGFAAGLGGLFAVGVLAVVSKLNGAGKWLTIASLAIFFLLIFVFLPTDQLANAYGNFFSNDPASAEGRAPIWSDSRKLLAAYPVFGTGLGTYRTAFLKYQTADIDLAYTYAHNDYLELASELGAVGFLIFGGLFLIALVKAIRAAFSEDWNTRLLGLGLTGAMTAIAIHSLVDFNLYIPANALLLSWIVGMAISVPSPSDAEEQSAARPHVFRLSERVTFRIVPALLACVLVVYATAWIVFETKYKGDPRAESFFCQFGICRTTAVFADDAPEDQDTVAKASLPFLVEAVKREPAAPQRWCDLGDSFLRAGQRERARYCYTNAQALGPEIPPILVRSATFYHAVQEDKRALEQGARVVEKSDIYRPVILDWYRTQKFSVNEVLCRGLPPGPLGAQAYLRYWIGQGDLDSAQATWDWILSHQDADFPITRDYINFLFGKGKYQEASTAWAVFLGDRGNGYRKSNWLYNGDFESEPSGVQLDWEIASIPDQVETAIDPEVSNTGSHSLRIHFAGKENVNYAHATQKTFVPPGTYRFTAFIRTQDVTTDRGVAFHIFDPEKPSRVDARTDQFVGTTGWKKVEQIVRVPDTTKVLAVQVIREPTMKFDNKVSGTAWIDTVSLSRIE